MDRDIATLRARLSDAARLEFAAAGPAFERRGLRRWEFGELPEMLALRRDGERRTGYPALVDETDGVALMLLDTREAALVATRKGVVRLIGFELGDSLARMSKAASWPPIATPLRAVVPLDALQDDFARAVADRAYVGDDPLPRDRDAFVAQVKRARARLSAVFDALVDATSAIAAAQYALSQKIAAMPATQRMLAAEAKAQRDALVYPGFLSATPWARLSHVPRFLDRSLSAESRARPAACGAGRGVVVALPRARRSRASRGRRVGGARRFSVAPRGASRVPFRAGIAHQRAGVAQAGRKGMAGAAGAGQAAVIGGIQCVPVLESKRQ
jgi:ATP-dependent helicase HrpA